MKRKFTTTIIIRCGIVAGAGVLCFAPGLVIAQERTSSEYSAPEYSAPEYSAPEYSAPAPSVILHVQMTDRQVTRLNRIHDAYSTRRVSREADIARWQSELRAAQSPAAFNQEKANGLSQNIKDTQQAIATDLLSSRAQALEVLSPVQKSQLESLATDPRMRVRHDKYFELLLLPVENLWQSPVAASRQSYTPQYTNSKPPAQQEQPRRRKNRQGSGSYGVYGGYSYGGPTYGVYGSYGEGPVGVHAGIGRGGPSVGVSVGSVFGRWHR